ncbi:decarboxylating NADP(+)-dependent phosphogluconate dehydrogenase [Victivallis sp. Marseille-Q1083]|uniref:decarboxylating NADP(+)-dependent phosphogluconate dehydrogenase n=1 Tax=Victivallis sp. Marseille-Q1083 TaxID=2717288 RepID=UPI00158A0BDC|nr:decarboxylating NADP(+)-dependent phosphogluconate dehydrogenase [Victivallis sp. Marseille-Q1083]
MDFQGDIGLIGLAVMGENLVMNLAGHHYQVAVFNRTVDKVEKFVNGRGKTPSIAGCRSLPELVRALKRPRRVMMMVRAGTAVDELIDQLLPLLEPGDVVIDGGNSHYTDTRRRTRKVEAAGLLYVGAGISGGELGALNGPSIMPGGSAAAWPLLREMFQAIAAQLPDDLPCCDWIGPDGAGHYVKMVHNGIEYADMQLIAETYEVLRKMGKLTPEAIAGVFGEWNRGALNSYLLEITAEILRKVDPVTEKPLIDVILDCAGQKGTGRWTADSALELGVPLSGIIEAVQARSLSDDKARREMSARLLPGPALRPAAVSDQWLAQVRSALYVAKIAVYAQGFQLLKRAAKEFGWPLDYGRIAGLWRGGCIIRAIFLNEITAAYRRNPELDNLLLDEFFRRAAAEGQEAWRRTAAAAALSGVAAPVLSATLNWYDGLRTAESAANLIQAQRDYFGAHTYERTDAPRGKFFHTVWSEAGGGTVSGSYDA